MVQNQNVLVSVARSIRASSAAVWAIDATGTGRVTVEGECIASALARVILFFACCFAGIELSGAFGGADFEFIEISKKRNVIRVKPLREK